MGRTAFALVGLLLALALPVHAAPTAKELFGAQTTPSSHRAEPFGGYSKGCIAGAVQLPETGPTWQAMRLSRNRNWGHPEMIEFLQRLSAYAATQPGWAGLYIGDISQPRGGPMLTGHGWTAEHHKIIRAAAKDPAVARIFVFPGAKVQMCKSETGNRDWLRKVRPWWGHHYHFHVRLNCPRGARACAEQDPIPAGDGCDEAQQWVNNILNPPPPDPNAPPPQPRRELTLADLPQACAQVLSR